MQALKEGAQVQAQVPVLKDGKQVQDLEDGEQLQALEENEQVKAEGAGAGSGISPPVSGTRQDRRAGTGS